MKVQKVKGEGRQLQLKYMLLYNFNAACFGLSTKGHYQAKLEVSSKSHHVI